MLVCRYPMAPPRKPGKSASFFVADGDIFRAGHPHQWMYGRGRNTACCNRNPVHNTAGVWAVSASDEPIKGELQLYRIPQRSVFKGKLVREWRRKIELMNE